jgi:hypothetical protein
MKRLLLNSLILVALGALTAPAVAQYKWRSADGITVYSDVPPPGGARQMNDRTSDEPLLSASASDAAPQSTPAVELPYELKTVSGKHPVVLYTAPECAPCALARQHLGTRGVPFSEKSISTSADFEAFKTRGFSENSFPAMTVGREKTVGFEAGAYDRLLTAAGYPRNSKLPANYKQAAAEPMTAPPPQKLTVNVQRETVAAEAPAADKTSTIERYRQQLEQARSANRAIESGPSMRF